MSFNTIIVDDQDARISYSGQWSLAGSEMDYRHTLFTSQNSGASATFTFNGTSMILMGNIDDNVSCNATISLDGSNYNFTSPAISTPLHQGAIWSSPTLPEGSHTFIYTIESCSNSSGNVWFDHILYNSTASDGATYFVDDRDSLLQYSGNWEQAGGDGDFWHTRQGGRVGSSVKLDFQGSSISVFGRVDNSSSGIVSASFSVDGSTPISFATSAQSFISYNKQFYQSRVLEPGVHNLVITSNSDNPLWIDYLLIQNGTSAPATAAASSNSDSEPSKTLLVGSILGAVGFIVLVIIAANIWGCRRRQHRQPARPTALQAKPKRYPSISTTTSVTNRPMDLETMSPRQRFPVAASLNNHSRMDSAPSWPVNNTEFIPQDPFQSSSSQLRTHRSHLSESSLTSRPSTRRVSTLVTAETSSFVQQGSTAPSSFITTTSSTRTRTVVNPSEENSYSAAQLKKKGENVVVLTQNGLYSSSGPMMHRDSGLRLDMEELLRETQHDPDDLPPMYTRD